MKIVGNAISNSHRFPDVIASGVALFATDQHHPRHECTEFSYFIYMYYLVVLL